MGLLNFLPDDPNKKEAARAGLLSLGAAMLQGRGNFGQMLGQGIGAGAQGYHGALASQQKSMLDQEQAKRWQLENQTAQAALDEPANIAKIIGQQQPPAQPPANSAASLVSGAPVGAAAPLAALPKTGQPAAPAQRETQYAKYMQYGDALSAAGKVTQAKQYYDMADKMKPKLKEQRTLMVDGKRVQVNVYDDGRTEMVDGYAPDAEKLNFQNTGASTVALDPYTGKPVNTITNTQSPDSVASGRITMRGQNMTDARTREATALTRALPRGQIVQSEDGPILVDPRTGKSIPVLGADGQPVGKTKAPTEFQGKSASFGARADQADKIISSLDGKYSPSAINAKQAVEDTWLIGGALGAATNKFALDENDQKAEQAQRDFINAVLRQESGAAIADSEFANAKKQYFPQPGDKPANIRQKSENRKLAIKGFQKNAGRAGFTSDAPNPSAPPLPAGWSVEVK